VAKLLGDGLAGDAYGADDLRDGGAAWTRATTVARATGVSFPPKRVLTGDLTVVGKCFKNLRVQLFSPVNILLVLYS
jgi:hypothetical protein